MKSYDEICKEVGFNRHEKAPVLSYHWIAYSGGLVIPCKSQFDASKYTLNEKVVDPESKRLHDEYFKSRQTFELVATEKFMKYLREEYDYISDELFQVCYSDAYDRGHSSGYDSVATYMNGIVEFALLVRKIK